VSALSGGQKQRVALARTLLRHQPILLLDEPFNGLDEAAAHETRREVLRLVRQQAWHTLLVTHDRGDIEALADRVLNLIDGRLQPA
jgi:ABC-type sulfate/molybdate transport systems ATPase subunit